MSVYNNPTIKHLEMVVLPGVAPTVIDAGDFRVGPHTVFISALVDLGISAPSDDDETAVDTIRLPFGPFWRDEFLQASTMTAWGEIHAENADEDDHATWGVRNLRTAYQKAAQPTTPGNAIIVRQLALIVDLVTQGEENTWRRIGFQTIANGTLLNPSDTIQRVHQPLPVVERG